ncbi:MAG: hypothetical protein WCP29_05775 [Acidobacteriota bacterium]
MKTAACLLLLLCVSSAMVAQPQLPRVPLPKRLPSPEIALWSHGEPPLSTSLQDARIEVPWLDRVQTRPGNMASIRNSRGTFTLKPGHWTIDVQSFCLHAGTRGPRAADGQGYLSAPMRGPQAQIVSQLIERSALMPEISQRDLQTLMWAVLSKARIREMSSAHQALATRLLTEAQLTSLDTSSVGVIPVSLRRRVFAALPPALRQIAEAENRVRDVVLRANPAYAELERAAVLTGPLAVSARTVPRGRWSIHPGGYLIRYAPSSYRRTTIDIGVPARVTISRDRIGRVVSVDWGDGRRTETEYDDSVPAFSPPDAPQVVAYAFKSVRLTRLDSAGSPERIVIADRGWTFTTSPQAFGPAPRTAPSFGFRSASAQLPSRMEQFRQWKERYDVWNTEFRKRAEWYQQRWDRSTGPPPDVEQSLRDLEDLEHYRDGIKAALRGDVGARLDWLIDHEERMNAALERATILLSGLPDRPDAEYLPSTEMAMPAHAGGQRLGLSSRPF